MSVQKKVELPGQIPYIVQPRIHSLAAERAMKVGAWPATKMRPARSCVTCRWWMRK